MSLFIMALAGAFLSPVAELPAETDRIDVTRTIRTSDLDLRSWSGRELLDRRILNAVQALCPRDTRRGLISGNRERDQCLAAAMRGAKQDRDRLLAGRGVKSDYRTADRAR